MQSMQHQLGAQLEPGVILVGHKLHAFAQDKASHLRSVRGGRPALGRFALQYPTSEGVEFPPEWIDNPKAATRVLENWLKVPGNPFNPSEERDPEILTQEHERQGPLNGTNTPNKIGLEGLEDSILIGPLSLRSRRKQNQAIDDLKKSLKLILV
jgi:hypothetical protein